MSTTVRSRLLQTACGQKAFLPTAAHLPSQTPAQRSRAPRLALTENQYHGVCNTYIPLPKNSAATPADARQNRISTHVRGNERACSAGPRGVATVCAHMRELPEQIACISFDLQCVSRHKRRFWVFIRISCCGLPSSRQAVCLAYSTCPGYANSRR